MNLIAETVKYTDFSKVYMRTNSEGYPEYHCINTKYSNVDPIVIYKNPKSNMFVLERTDNFYNRVDMDIIKEKTGLSIYEFCESNYSSLEDLCNKLTSILKI